MAKKNSMTLPLLIGGGALAVWYFFFRNTAAAAPAPTSAIPGNTANYNGPGIDMASPGTVSPLTGVSTAAAGYPTQNQNNTNIVIVNWMNTLSPANRNQALSQLPNMTVDETNELADIIVNVWAKGIAPSATQTAFWNAWRVKYHILDGTYQ